MSFIDGFEKTAGPMDEAAVIAGRLRRGVGAAAKDTVGDTLKLKGVSHISDAAKASGGWGKMITSKGGRRNLAEAVGKAAPSLAVGGGYAYGAKKLYDKASGNNNSGYGGGIGGTSGYY
jgi:hypothetical protein